MYLPKYNQQTDIAALYQLATANPLAMWVVATDDDVLINHIPFLMEPPELAGSKSKLTENSTSESESSSVSIATVSKGKLKAHIAKANPLFKLFESGQSIRKSVVVFQGQQTYITPAWYLSKAEHGKVVPTWNYMVMHASGTPVLQTDKQWLHNHVTALTNAMESATKQSHPEHRQWQVTDAPDDYIDMRIKGIAGVEIAIATLTGKWKLGQNRTEADQSSLCENYFAEGLETMGQALDND